MDGDFSDVPSAPVFVLSYARARAHGQPTPPDADPSVRKLFEDLSGHVNRALSLLPGQYPGFMDARMSAGEQWRRELLRVVGSCQVFVALLSSPYLRDSAWCAMEWDLFARRAVVLRPDRKPLSGNRTMILPVVWIPPEHDYPPPVAKVQRFMPDGIREEYITLYKSDGLFGALQVNPDAYAAIVWKLARQIQIVSSTYQVEMSKRTTTEGLLRSFDEDAS